MRTKDHSQSSSSKPRIRRERSTHKKERPSRESPVTERKEKKKKPLNDYQKFVKAQSRKDKYRNMRGSERLASIALEWEAYKKKLSKRVEKYKDKKRARK
jgi:hypothetical protein